MQVAIVHSFDSLIERASFHLWTEPAVISKKKNQKPNKNNQK